MYVCDYVFMHACCQCNGDHKSRAGPGRDGTVFNRALESY